MRLEDLAKRNREPNAKGGISATDGKPKNANRTDGHPEIAELLNARRANALFDCPALARDEIELANFLANKLEVDLDYVPSETVLKTIRNLCDRISGQASFAGMIRTG